jgi:hypothetical protein
MSKKSYQPASPEELGREARQWDSGAVTHAGWEDAPEAIPRVGGSTLISLRLPTQMLGFLKAFAEREGVGYQVLMKRWLDECIRQERDRMAVHQAADRKETEQNSTESNSPLWDVRGWKQLTIHEDPQLTAAREEFLAWLAEVPGPHRTDLERRLQSELDHNHLSARLELFVYHYFCSNGWDVQVHPQVVQSPNRPDFLVEKDEARLLVECRSVFDQSAVEQQDQRLRQLAEETGRRLGRTVVLYPLSDLPPSIPAKRIRSWIEQQPIPDDAPLLLEFDLWDKHQGHRYGVRAILPKLEGGGEELTGVHGLMSQAQTVMNVHRLRMALQEKASKYGTLEVPYMIAVAGETKFPISTEHAVDALLGDRVLHIPQQGHAEVTETRKPNGFFTAHRDNIPRYNHVSAVLVYRFKWLDDGHQHRMHVYHNPHASTPVDPSLFPDIPQFVRQGTTMRWINGEPDPY